MHAHLKREPQSRSAAQGRRGKPRPSCSRPCGTRMAPARAGRRPAGGGVLACPVMRRPGLFVDPHCARVSWLCKHQWPRRLGRSGWRYLNNNNAHRYPNQNNVNTSFISHSKFRGTNRSSGTCPQGSASAHRCPALPHSPVPSQVTHAPRRVQQPRSSSGGGACSTPW